jgi:hypothetical protein
MPLSLYDVIHVTVVINAMPLMEDAERGVEFKDSVDLTTAGVLRGSGNAAPGRMGLGIDSDQSSDDVTGRFLQSESR